VNALGLVFLQLVAIAAPLAGLAWWLRVYPRRGLVYLALAPALVSFAVLVVPTATLAIIAIDVFVGLVALADALTLPRRRAFSAERTALRIASLRKPHPVTLTLVNQSTRAYAVAVRD
jgi:uncharacterized protein (DUF58 family)